MRTRHDYARQRGFNARDAAAGGESLAHAMMSLIAAIVACSAMLYLLALIA